MKSAASSATRAWIPATTRNSPRSSCIRPMRIITSMMDLVEETVHLCDPEGLRHADRSSYQGKEHQHGRPVDAHDHGRGRQEVFRHATTMRGKTTSRHARSAKPAAFTSRRMRSRASAWKRVLTSSLRRTSSSRRLSTDYPVAISPLAKRKKDEPAT